MRKLLCLLATLATLVFWIPIASAQEDVEENSQLDSAASQGEAERRARQQELGQLTREERQQRRQRTREQLESLSDEQRQAIRERRRTQTGARGRQGGNGRPPANRQRPPASQRGAPESQADSGNSQQDQ